MVGLIYLLFHGLFLPWLLCPNLNETIDFLTTGRVKLNMKTPLVIASILMVLFISTFSFAKDVSFTQEDRDRLIRLEVKVEESSKALNQRIDSLQQLIYILIGVVVAQTIGVIGFVLWDRRTAPRVPKNS